MTALPEESPVDPRITDAELVGASIEGDRAAFAQIYDRYADRLYDFCAGMLRDLDGAADCVQETFYLAATRLRQLRDPDRLRPWLYAIARNEALRRLGEWHRETPAEDLPDTPSQDAGPDTLSARSELAELIAEVAGGLSDRDRAVLDLAFRHGLNGPDLADALGMTHTNANTVVARLRRTIERSLGALLVSRSTRKTPGGCTQLRDILAGWDGRFTVLVRKRVSRHIESCPTCDEQRRRLVSPAALLGAVPLIPAPESLRDRTLTDIQLTSHGSAMTGVAGDTAGSVPDRARRRHSRMLLAALMPSLVRRPPCCRHGPGCPVPPSPQR
ncbi:RNA polymerase sigma factor [Mycolicibacterium sp. HK-90]|uniref:RNA polymerase sigma factor n=1 Tax=Mycolicibacterium sp. HK-90 TaxID=3056937 RepID=UPI00265A8E3E|nr:RNA polymerase sigma factor [Mycolicibacterium sp. HK-90]WKG03336.1 RNA polymerase sigma factor [Mycolicibacterium sp. HK-90]